MRLVLPDQNDVIEGEKENRARKVQLEGEIKFIEEEILKFEDVIGYSNNVGELQKQNGLEK